MIARDDAQVTSADAIRAALASRPFLGIVPEKGVVPDRPERPSIAVRVSLAGPEGKAKVQVSILASNADSGRWDPAGKFTLLEDKAGGESEPSSTIEAIAERVLGQLVRVELLKGGSANGNKAPDRLRIVNASPLILHGLMVAGSSPDQADGPTLRGLALAPRRALTVTVAPKAVQKLGLRSGVRPTAADLGSL